GGDLRCADGRPHQARPERRPRDRGGGGAPAGRDRRARRAARPPPRDLRQDGRLRAEERPVPRDGRGREEGGMNAYGNTTVAISIVTMGLGVALIAVTAAHGGGIGILLGLLFLALGAGRLYLARGGRR